MMKRFLLALSLLAAGTAHADLLDMGVTASAGGAVYSGPGDVVSGALVWYGLRAYNRAYATALGKIAQVCLPSGGGCFDVASTASGNFNLAGVAGLSTCNNTTVLCTVQTLYDQSGANACGGGVPCDVTNSTHADQPILVLPGGCTPTTGTFDASKFCLSTGSGASSPRVLVATADLTSGSPQPFTVSVVYDNPTRDSDETIFGSNNYGWPVIAVGYSGPGIVAISAGVSPATVAGVAEGTYHAVQTVFNNATSDIYVDGTSHAPLNIATGSAMTTNRILVLNVASPGTIGFTGLSVEFGLWPSSVTWTTTQSGAMNSNQHAYWGF
jgi:hypothetical protein